MSIIKLSSLTEKQKKSYQDYYENVLLKGALGITFLKPTEQYDEFGLRFPAEYLQNVGVYIIFYPLEIMAEYVDQTTKELIDTDDYFKIGTSFLANFNLDDEFNELNATSIGNLAYACLFCKEDFIKESCERLLNQIFERCKGKFLEDLKFHIDQI